MRDCIILSTGGIFQEAGVGNIRLRILDLVESAEEEIHVVTYSLSPEPRELWAAFERAVLRGVNIHILVDPSVFNPQSLLDVLGRFPENSLHLYLFRPDQNSRLHAKFLTVDGNRAILGSANFTGAGLFSNHEVAVYLEGEPAWILKKMASRLISLSEEFGSQA